MGKSKDNTYTRCTKYCKKVEYLSTGKDTTKHLCTHILNLVIDLQKYVKIYNHSKDVDYLLYTQTMKILQNTIAQLHTDI